jgi:hypothetical protein
MPIPEATGPQPPARRGNCTALRIVRRDFARYSTASCQIQRDRAAAQSAWMPPQRQEFPPCSPISAGGYVSKRKPLSSPST